MKPMLMIAFVIGAVAAVAAVAQEKAPSRARTIVDQICSNCHGTDGNSPTAVNPNLAGLPADYITLQLTHFRSGIRTNPIMAGMAATLAPDDMKALGVYFSTQKHKGLAARDPTLVKAGRKIFRGGDTAAGIPPCASCHGPDGSGIPKSYPRLAGQYAEYSYAQLKAFKAAERGADKDGRDRNGSVMVSIAGRMSDAQMKAVAEYTSGLR